jgi:hypothetical protein
MPAAGSYEVTVPEPLMEPLRRTDFLARLIAEATERPAQEVMCRLAQEHRQLGCNVQSAMREWGLEPHRWSDALVRLYAESDAFLFEATAWNRSRAKCSMRKWIATWLARTVEGSRR